jgi:hypothetical protein
MDAQGQRRASVFIFVMELQQFINIPLRFRDMNHRRISVRNLGLWNTVLSTLPTGEYLGRPFTLIQNTVLMCC